MNRTSTIRRLEPGQVDVWCCATDEPRLLNQYERYEAILSDEEKEEYRQRQFSTQAGAYLVSRALLRTVLSEYCDLAPEALSFGTNEFGKPELLGEATRHICFNAAHTHGLTLCAVSGGQAVGIDVEFQTDSAGMLDAADDYLSADEATALRSVAEEQKLSAFFRYWTLKEAYLKARGQGLSIALHEFSFLLDGMNVTQFIGPDAARWDFRLLAQDNDFTAAVAVDGKISQLNAFHSMPLISSRELASLQDILPAT